MRNFETRIIDPRQYVDEIYSVYIDSLKGYPAGVHPLAMQDIDEVANTGWSQESCRFFGAFDKISGRLCGYSDVYEHGLFLPISSLHSRMESEKKGVNLALIAGIVEWYVKLDREGSYLCDGARNVSHETNFQDFLVKYFGFRRAYCKLHVVYRPIVGTFVMVLFPFRSFFKKMRNKGIRKIYSILKMEAWRRGLPE